MANAKKNSKDKKKTAKKTNNKNNVKRSRSEKTEASGRNTAKNGASGSTSKDNRSVGTKNGADTGTKKAAERASKIQAEENKKTAAKAVKNTEDGDKGVVVKESHGSREILAVILAAIGVFLIFSMFGKTGQLGRFVVALLFGLIGKFASIALLVMLFVLAWTVLRGTSRTVFSFKNVALFSLMLLFAAAMVHTFDFRVEHYEGLGFMGVVTTLWQEQDRGGGVIGGLISYGLQSLVARPGTLIILIPATLILAMVLFSLSLVKAAKKVASAGGKFGNWMSGVIGRFKESDAISKEKRRKAQEEKARRKEQKAAERKAENADNDLGENSGEGGDGSETHSADDSERYRGYTYENPEDDLRGEQENTEQDDHIEFVSARGRRKEMFEDDLKKQQEKRREAERKIMSQEDDDELPEDGGAAFLKASRTAKSDIRGARDTRDTSGEYTDGGEQERDGRELERDREDDGYDGTPTEISEREALPDVDPLPTKIPPKNEEIRVVTCNEEAVYELPPHNLLVSEETDEEDAAEQQRNAKLTARKLEEVMRSFGIEAKVIRISIGSTVTMFELSPQSGVKVSRIKNLSDDIALNLAATGVRILAPIPGKAAIGIEIPNEDRRTVYLKDLIETEAFTGHRSKLAFCLGEDISGTPIIADIAKMPHLLIAGTTGSGKSVCINCIIMSMLYRLSPNDVRMIMIDPKVVELQVYNNIPHLLIPVVTEPRKAAAALAWAVQEMENRYRQFARYNLRDINAYNAFAPDNGLPRMPRIVIIIDELADLMMVVRDSVEEAINRIAQKARAAGMHLIVATQRPSVDVITGLIKANIPSRIAFTVSSVVDSKTILDYGGAEKLLGKGDMLYHPLDFLKPIRVQGGYVSDGEIEDTVNFLKIQRALSENDAQISNDIDNARLMEKPGRAGHAGDGEGGSDDPLLADALDIAIETKQVSASFLQRKLGLGYSRASRLIDQLEARGFISARDGNNPRQVLISHNPLR